MVYLHYKIAELMDTKSNQQFVFFALFFNYVKYGTLSIYISKIFGCSHFVTNVQDNFFNLLVPVYAGTGLAFPRISLYSMSELK